MYRRLFSSVRIGSVELKNRIAMPPFGLNFTGIKRVPNDRLIDFYETRAKGGAGLLIVGGVGIDMQGSGLMLPGIDKDDAIPHWKRLAEAVHRHDARLFLQLFHSGRYSHRSLAGGMEAVAPSAVASRYTGETPRALTLEEIAEIQEKFAEAARRAVEAGVDGVEIIASAGYLICQFMSPVTNLREDPYGGSEENRARFGVEVLLRIRREVGDSVPITMRLSGNEFVAGGNASTDIWAFARRFEAAGAQAFNVTGGWHETLVPQLPGSVPFGAYTYLAQGIKRETSVPVFASNRITTPEQAEELLANGICDVVSVGRALIADPDWPEKARVGKGTQIRPCVGCMQGCLDRLFTMKAVECLCNPQAGYEGKRHVVPTATPLKVLVIGGGPAGMETAITASDRGHEVTLVEAAESLGGQLPLVAAPPGRGDFGYLQEYFRREVQRRPIRVDLGTRVDVDWVTRRSPDKVIVATGARPVVPAIPVEDGVDVCSSWDILSGAAVPGRNVVVVGGGAVGIETALAIAERGTMDGDTVKFLLKHQAETCDTLRAAMTRSPRRVTIVEQLPKLGKDVGKSTRWVFLKELELYGVSVQLGAQVVRAGGGRVYFRQEDEERSVEADTLVWAVGSASENALAKALEQAGIQPVVVGDARKARTIVEAIHEGFLAACEL
jgi:2,4-dienoyl-CoA reductase (NADPH2)